MAARTSRLFFAIWPEDALRERVLALSAPWRGALRCRWTPPEKLHLTLAFLGDVMADRRPELEAVGASLRLSAPCRLRFDRLELWPRPQVLCLVGEAPESLRELVAELNRSLAAAGFATERRPYRPHLTLARHLRRMPEATAFEPIGWQASSLRLVESRPELPGAPYFSLKSWDLTAPAAG